MRQFFSVILCSFLFFIHTQTVFGVNLSCNKPVSDKNDARQGVVRIMTEESYNGTGFIFKILDKKVYIFTAYHTLLNNKTEAKSISVKFPILARAGIGKRVSEKGQEDLAIIEVEFDEVPKELRSLSITKTKYYRNTEEGYVIGHPAESNIPWRYIPVNFFQNNESTLYLLKNMLPGVSGAPIIQEGCVVGLVHQNNKAFNVEALNLFLRKEGLLLDFSPPPPLPPVINGSEECIHLVQHGEMLSKIAGMYYECDSQLCWRHILNANSEKLGGDEKNLKPQMKIVIPPPSEEIYNKVERKKNKRLHFECKKPLERENTNSSHRWSISDNECIHLVKKV